MTYPVFTERELRRGVKLLYSQTRDFKSALIRVSFAVPLSKETASGYSLLTNMLSLTTKEYPDIRSFAEAKEELYALSLDSYVDRLGETLFVTFSAKCISDSFAIGGDRVLENTVKMLGGAVFAPNAPGGEFPPDLLEGEKRSLVDEIESIIEDKPAFAFRRAVETMCAGEPYSADASGDAELVKKLDGKTLYEKYYKNCVENAPVFIMYVGEAEIGEVAGYIEKYLPFCARGAKLPRCTAHVPGGLRRLREITRADECSVVIGASHRMLENARERAAHSLFDVIVGGAAGRLFVNVREKEGLCYYCGTVSPGAKNVCFITCGTEHANAARAEEAILREFESAAHEGVSEAELEKAKKTLLLGLDSVGASPGALIRYMFLQALAAPGDVRDIAELRDLILSVTPCDILEVTDTYVTELIYILDNEDND